MIKWCVEHKIIVLMLSIFILVGGSYVYLDLERQENPTITPPIALVQCIYPGASPEDVEKQIIKPLEKEIGKVEDVKTIESYSLDSVGIIKVTLKDMSDSAILNHWQKLKDKVDDAKTSLPETAMAPTVDTELANSFGLVIGISSKDYTNQDLKRVAKKLERELSQVQGVAEVKLNGEVSPSIDIQLDMAKLKQYGISANTIGTALKARNVNIPGGNLNLQAGKVPIQITGEYKGVEEIRDTIVGVSETTGLPVQMKDLATVSISEKEPDRYALVGKDKAVLIGVRYASGQNVLEAGKRVEKVIETFRSEQLYKNMTLSILTNQPDYVKEAIDLFVDNLASAIALVVAVVWLFMGFRSSVVVSVSIPLVVAIVLLYMKMTGIPLHQISIASLIISLSLLVANGIVANDNMYLYLQQGKSRKDAIIRGVKDVNIPILTSTLTTIASFLPLAMMQGSAGKFASALPVLVSVSLIASYLTSLTIVPALGHKILEVRSRKGGWVDHIVHWLKIDVLGKKTMAIYHKQLQNAIKRPKTTIAIFVAILAATTTMIPSLGMQVFPPIQRDQYVMTVTLPNGVTMEHTKKVAVAISQLIDQEKSVTSYASEVGDGFIQYYDTFSAARRGTNVAEFLINGDRDRAEVLANLVQDKVPEAAINLKFLELNMPQDQPVQIRIAGSDIDTLKATAEAIERKVKMTEGVLRSEINYGKDSYKLKVDVDEARANLSGITNYDVASTVRMAVNGAEITELKQKDVDEDATVVTMRIGKSGLSNVADLNQIFITSQLTGENVPLSQIAKLKTESSLNQIVRRNEMRTITVGLYLKPEVSSQSVLSKVEKTLETYQPPKGYVLSYGGDNEFAEETFSSMVVPALLAIALIYVIITFQFGSLLDPLIIMGTIPLSFIGVLGGLKIMNYPIGFMAMLGAISLMGVVVNNGIVLLDYIKQLQREGKTLNEAVVEGSVTRLRPIMIGMLTTVISLIPMMFSGGPLWQPLAAALNFGMVVSTVLTLIVIPAAYVLVEKIREKHAQQSHTTQAYE